MNKSEVVRFMSEGGMILNIEEIWLTVIVVCLKRIWTGVNEI
jgi:hypothetical protein